VAVISVRLAIRPLEFHTGFSSAGGSVTRSGCTGSSGAHQDIRKLPARDPRFSSAISNTADIRWRSPCWIHLRNPPCIRYRVRYGLDDLVRNALSLNRQERPSFSLEIPFHGLHKNPIRTGKPMPGRGSQRRPDRLEEFFPRRFGKRSTAFFFRSQHKDVTSAAPDRSPRRPPGPGFIRIMLPPSQVV